jgi:hypothetical protein
VDPVGLEILTAILISASISAVVSTVSYGATAGANTTASGYLRAFTIGALAGAAGGAAGYGMGSAFAASPFWGALASGGVGGAASAHARYDLDWALGRLGWGEDHAYSERVFSEIALGAVVGVGTGLVAYGATRAYYSAKYPANSVIDESEVLPFDTREQAARYQAQKYHEATVYTKREFGAWIYRSSDGKYVLGPTSVGNTEGVGLDATSAGYGPAWGDWHTHSQGDYISLTDRKDVTKTIASFEARGRADIASKYEGYVGTAEQKLRVSVGRDFGQETQGLGGMKAWTGARVSSFDRVLLRYGDTVGGGVGVLGMFAPYEDGCPRQNNGSRTMWDGNSPGRLGVPPA